MAGSVSKAMILCGIAGLCLFSSRAANAQGISGSSLEGTVRRQDGSGIRSASVELRDSATASVRTATTDASGRYRFVSVAPGTYALSFRAVGLALVRVPGFELHLGDRAQLDIEMRPAAQSIGEIVVRAASARDAGAGGSAQSLPRQVIQRMMILDRDFVRLLAMSSQAVGPGALWIGGQHSRFNSIQVDGTTASDFFGTNVTPGSNSGGRSIPLEAIDEVKILTAPFDVRQGGFSGGLINAITRSGSNELHASAVTSFSRSDLVGDDSSGVSVPAFSQVIYGLSAGGPIIRDKLHWFGVAELQSKNTRFTGPSADDPTTGVSRATVQRAERAFRERFGFDPGDESSPELAEPTGNLFAKLSWQPSVNQSVEITPFLSRARSDQLSRQVRNLQNSDAWQLSGSGSTLRNSTAGLRLRSTGTWGAATNEAIASITSVSDKLNSRQQVPLFVVQADLPNYFLSAGSAKGSQGTETSHRIIEITDNLSLQRGNHVFTLGTQNWFVRVSDNFLSGAWGVWTFSNIDSLEHGAASRYEIAVPLRDQPLAEFWSALPAVYAQDQWRANDRVRITAGLRADMAFFQSPNTNAVLQKNTALGGIDTGVFPSGNVEIAPRLGFSWIVGRSRKGLIRGGVGAFTGRPPLVWLDNAFLNTGADQTLVVCTRTEGVPVPTADRESLPVKCSGGGSRSAANPSVTVFDRSFRFHQAVKSTIGADWQLGGAWSASVDLMRTATRDRVMISDRNLVERGLNTEGRMMYGSITAAGDARPTRIDSTTTGPVYAFGNASDEFSRSATFTLRREWKTGLFLQAGYTWSRTLDETSTVGFSSVNIFRNNPIEGSFDDRPLRRSGRDVPHNFVAIAVIPLKLGVTAALHMQARSGTPYAFTVSGDANADGSARNDLVYIPVSASDIDLGDPATYADLDALIERMPCLRSQRGSIMHRNSCRNPSVKVLDARLSKEFSLRASNRVEISADIFNLPNLINRRWGLVRETTTREDVQLLALSGWNATTKRPRYSIPTLNGAALFPAIDPIAVEASRWRAQLGARYEF